MNNRIEELKRQAYQYADRNSQDGDNNFGNRQLDKFAELIVLECMGLFAPGPKEDLRVQLADAQARSIIKQHFGVDK